MKKVGKRAVVCVLSIGMMMSTTIGIHAYEKEETVYTTLNADGSVDEIVVSDHLKANGEKQIQDQTDLSDVVNVNGEESFTKNKDQIVWENNGNDIFYEGKSKKQLPIKTTINYKLNGKEIKAKKLKGKSGKVEIQLQFQNLEKHDDLYTPFVVTSMLMLSTKENTDIQVTNGKVISNGSTNFVLGIASPGLYESLGNVDALQNLDTITITYQTKKFDASSLYILATPKVLEAKDFNFDQNLSTIYDNVTKLSQSSKQLVSGSQQLCSGIMEFQKNYQKFHDGIKQLEEGNQLLLNHYQQLDQGMQALSQQSASFQNVEELLGQLSQLGNATQQLDGGIQSLKEAVQNTSDPNTATNQEIARLKSELATKQEELVVLQQNMGALKTELQKRYQNLSIIAQQLQTIESEDETLLSARTNLTNEVDALGKDLTQLDMGMEALHNNLTKIQEDMAALDQISNQTTATTIASLKKAIAQFSTGNEQLKNGMEQINQQTAGLPAMIQKFIQGTNQLAAGSKAFYGGMKQTNDASQLLYSFSKQFYVALQQMVDGAQTLAKGMNQFDQEGITPITTIIDTLNQEGTKMKRLIKLSDAYRTYTKADSSIKSDVKFMYVVHIGKES